MAHEHLRPMAYKQLEGTPLDSPVLLLELEKVVVGFNDYQKQRKDLKKAAEAEAHGHTRKRR